MSDKRNQLVGRYIKRQRGNIGGIYYYIGYFFIVAALLTLFVFDNMLISEIARPENTTWLNAQVQSQFKFAFRSLANVFFVLSLASLSVPLLIISSSIFHKIKQRIKKKSA